MPIPRYTKLKACYDKGATTHYHAMVNTMDYDRVVEFIKQQF